MKNLFYPMYQFFLLLRCVGVIAQQTFAILINLMIDRQISRSFINRITRRSAIKLLQILRTSYHIECNDQSLLENDNAFIYMSNHQSLIDIPLIYATFVKTIRPVTKAELFRIPFFSQAMHIAECVPVFRNDSSKTNQFVTFAKQKIASGVSLWIFPEGTRSRDGKLLSFKSGGFRIARETETKIVPVAILNTRNVMQPKQFFSLKLHQTIAIRVGEPIDVTPYLSQDKQDALKNEVHQAIQQLLDRPGKVF